MITAAALLFAGALPFAADAEIRGEVVRLGDIIDVAGLPSEMRRNAAVLPLARFDRDTPQANIPRAFLAAQARARMPGLAPWLAGNDTGTIRLHRRLRAGMPIVVSATAEGVTRGETVSLDIDTGTFYITRQAVAMTDARPGERLFVRTAEGKAVSARCIESAQ